MEHRRKNNVNFGNVFLCHFKHGATVHFSTLLEATTASSWAKDKSEIRLHLYYANPWIAGQSSPAQCQAPLRNNYRCMHLANIFNYFSTQIFSIEIFSGIFLSADHLTRFQLLGLRLECGLKYGWWNFVRTQETKVKGNKLKINLCFMNIKTSLRRKILFQHLSYSWLFEDHVYDYGTESVHTRSQAEECEQNNFLHINSI